MLDVQCKVYECMIILVFDTGVRPTANIEFMHGHFTLINTVVHRTSNIVPVVLHFCCQVLFAFPPFTLLYNFFGICPAFCLRIHNGNQYHIKDGTD